MKIGFCYDKFDSHPLHNKIDDVTAEYESEDTIAAQEKILSKLGEVIKLPWHSDIFMDIKKHNPDVIFNITESYGSRSRESYIPDICEMLAIPYTGSDGVALGVSLDKELTKHIARSLGIKTPDFIKVNSIEEVNNISLEYPLFVKPNSEGASMGIRQNSCVNNKEELTGLVQELIERYHEPVLIEEFVAGREFAVAVIGNNRPDTFPTAEILVEDGNFPFYSYEFKSAHQKTIKCPAEISEELEEEMERDSLNIFHALGCRDMARADFKLNDSGEPLFLEINPLPGLSPHYSVYPIQAAAGGMELEEIIHNLIDYALKRENY